MSDSEFLSAWRTYSSLPVLSLWIHQISTIYIFFSQNWKKLLGFCCSLQWKKKLFFFRETEIITQGLFTISSITVTIQTSACHALCIFSFHFSYKISLLHVRYSLILLQIPAEASFLSGIVEQWVKVKFSLWSQNCAGGLLCQLPSPRSHVHQIFLKLFLCTYSLIAFPLFLFTILLIVNKGAYGEFAYVWSFSLSWFKWGEGI